MHELEETPEGDVSGEEARREDEERQQDLSWDCAEIHYYTYTIAPNLRVSYK